VRPALLFALGFAGLTALGTWLWLAGGDALYAQAIAPLAREIYELLGIRGRGSLRRTRFINLVPFTALMLLTPRLAWRRRLGGLLLGWLALCLSHIALNGYAIASGARGHLPPAAAHASDALPLLLWLVIARDFAREKLGSLRRRGA